MTWIVLSYNLDTVLVVNEPSLFMPLLWEKGFQIDEQREFCIY